MSWHRRVAQARAEHDRHALEWRRAIDAAARARYGTTAEQLLSTVGSHSVLERTVTVRAGSILGTLGGAFAARPLPDSVVRVQVTVPSSPRGAAVVRLHGGAYWMGGGAVARTLDRALVRRLAHDLGAIVVAVDYRLAPEHPFPAAIVDSLAVVDALRSGALGDSVDPRRIAVVGTSSGANTASVAAFADLARGVAAPIAALGLLVPSADLSEPPPTAHGDPVSREMRERLVRGYLGDVSPSSPAASPALREDFTAAPPTFAAVARYDEVARGANALCAGIRGAGGVVELREYDMTHTVAPPETEAAVARDLIAFLSRYL